MGSGIFVVVWPTTINQSNKSWIEPPQDCNVLTEKKIVTLLDLCVSSLRRGHANLLCIVPILTDGNPEGNPTVTVCMTVGGLKNNQVCKSLFNMQVDLKSRLVQCSPLSLIVSNTSVKLRINLSGS